MVAQDYSNGVSLADRRFARDYSNGVSLVVRDCTYMLTDVYADCIVTRYLIIFQGRFSTPSLS